MAKQEKNRSLYLVINSLSITAVVMLPQIDENPVIDLSSRY